MFGSLHVSATVAGFTSSFCSRTAFLLAEGLGRPGVGGQSEGHSVNVYSDYIPSHNTELITCTMQEWRMPGTFLLGERCQYLPR